VPDLVAHGADGCKLSLPLAQKLSGNPTHKTIVGQIVNLPPIENRPVDCRPLE
jgi:hypothetical protein